MGHFRHKLLPEAVQSAIKTWQLEMDSGCEEKKAFNP